MTDKQTLLRLPVRERLVPVSKEVDDNEYYIPILNKRSDIFQNSGYCN